MCARWLRASGRRTLSLTASPASTLAIGVDRNQTAAAGHRLRVLDGSRHEFPHQNLLPEIERVGGMQRRRSTREIALRTDPVRAAARGSDRFDN